MLHLLILYHLKQQKNFQWHLDQLNLHLNDIEHNYLDKKDHDQMLEFVQLYDFHFHFQQHLILLNEYQMLEFDHFDQ